ncbi:MAG: acetyl-CoA carboxylase carboxyltransferase subunit alpha [Eubacteriales bacterium]|jgi:acetyl-CoA carboxylase carboxyl transferase subunit alpha|nr:acetyl-CoA carboxylase carboxyltransferase subunit alpha [Eubacteriales bacterium]MDD4286577.1 acetyl-CoA carboxylase carboxyltransferase subunit alpha [Eubacteriales bacterium]NLV70618.1 acetyl-CoA carboxylase carboxyltransferase subunit alpha [Clostridiales bacterium]
MNAKDHVAAARAKDRPTAAKYIKGIFDEFTELHGDRCFGDDPAMVGGVARLGQSYVTVIAQEKGTTTRERAGRNFGSAHPEGYRKALRLMKQAEKFGRPVITFVDTAGAFCGIGAEERGQGQAIASNLMEMMMLRVPVLAIFIGEGGSGGALGIAVADQVWMLENAFYSVISPEGCASILWKDPARAAEAAECLKLTAEDLTDLSVAEQIISEHEGNFEKTFAFLKEAIGSFIAEKQQIPVEELLRERYDKFRKIQ